jgi:transcriptional regulator with XRE-family HTH domain
LEDTRLAERHIALREQSGLTQEQEAKIARVSPTTISGIESGKITRPHLRTIIRLAGALGVRPEELSERELPKEQAPLPFQPDSPEQRRSRTESEREDQGRAYFPAFDKEATSINDMALLRQQRVSERALRLPMVYTGEPPTETAKERRERTYGPLGEGLHRLLDHWEGKVTSGDFEFGEVREFHATVRALSTTLAECERWEIADTPPEDLGEDNSNLIMNQAIRRLVDVLERVGGAVVVKRRDPERLKLLVQRENEETRKALIEGVEAANSA